MENEVNKYTSAVVERSRGSDILVLKIFWFDFWFSSAEPILVLVQF